MAKRRSPFVYFSGLSLTNVKAFGETQFLDLRDPITERPARWTLILGDNGVGKTTLLQCIALMRPILATPEGSSSDAPEPDRVQAALAERENSELIALARAGESAEVSLKAHLIGGRRLNGVGGKPTELNLSIGIEVRNHKLSAFEVSESMIPNFTEPLVIGYSAARHMSYLRGDGLITSDDPTEPLFDPSLELIDAEDILQRLDHARYKDNEKADDLLTKLKSALAKLLPDVESGEGIFIYGPAVPGSGRRKSGVEFRTPYGDVPFRSLSLGYQTTTAWAVDLAWKLFQHYPDSDDPLQEPAVVLIDELDLHLHPLWQRTLRPSISEFFPEVQFIATAHSPLIAQSYLDSNIVVLARKGDHVEIENDPAVVNSWGLDELVTSELFGLSSPYPPEIDSMIRERAALLKLARRTAVERDRLADLQGRIEAATAEGEACVLSFASDARV
jgi:hypothetical protein